MTKSKRSPKILMLSEVADNYIQPMCRYLPSVDITYAKRGREITVDPSEVEIFIGWRIRRELLSEMVNLKWVHAYVAGVDAFLREADLLKDKVLTRTIANLPELMAQYVGAVILGDVAGMPRHHENQKAKKWVWKPNPDICYKTVLIIGTGWIGSKIAESLAYWGMQVLGISRSGRDVKGFQKMFTAGRWEEAFPLADYIVIVLPQTAETTGFVDREKIAAMKEESVLINIARGSIVRENDLIESLQSGHPRRAVLDVFEKEPLPPESPLWDMPSVTITPHIAGVSDPMKVAEEFAENYKRYISGKPLQNVIDFNRGY